MTNLILRNRNQDSAHQTATVDFSLGYTTFDNHQRIKTNAIRSETDFKHPLLTEPVFYPKDNYFQCSYDTINDFFNIPKQIYATLLQSPHPVTCPFKITPSEKYLALKANYSIFFSAQSKRAAKEAISIQQLNALISETQQSAFHYQDKVVLNQILTLNDLAVTMDADCLYQDCAGIAPFCLQQDELHRYELRYINRRLGFGVFARERIAKGCFIAQYCGNLTSEAPINTRYTYSADPAHFNLKLHGHAYGNISRFINHAPKESNGRTLTANLQTLYYNCYGHNIIVLVAKRTIEKNEQLLNNYGDEYFIKSKQIIYLRHQGDAINAQGKTIQDTSIQRLQYLLLMKKHGIKHAQLLLLRKPLGLFFMILFVALLVNQ
jgi:hypothetical protein